MKIVETTRELRNALAGTPPRGPEHRVRSDDGIPPRRARGAARSGARRLRGRRPEPVREPGAVRPRRGPRPLSARPRGGPGTAERAGVDLVFAPSVEEVYPPGFATTVEVGGLTEILEGDPGLRGREHFRGVTTVVAKLLIAVGPDVAYFGQKDAQQAVVIRRMVRDLGFPTRIEVRPTVREPDGLAMSSRNSYLAPADRERAPAIHRAIAAAAAAARQGARADEVLAPAREILATPGSNPSTSRSGTPRTWRRSRS